MPSAFKVELLNGALDSIAHLNPEYSEFIGWIKQHETRAADLVNVIDAALRAGGTAIATIERDAPDLANAIKLFVNTASPEGNGKKESMHTENVARTCFGFPKMTTEEENAWMNRTSAISDDSRSGSG